MTTPSQRRETVIYYLGGLSAPNSDVDLTINIAQRSIRIGAIGSPIRVLQYVGDDMINKYNVAGKLIFSYDRKLAERAAKGEVIDQPKTLENYTRAELLAALKALEEEEQEKAPVEEEIPVTPELAALGSIFADDSVDDEDDEDEELSPAQKAALTRARNKAAAAAKEKGD